MSEYGIINKLKNSRLNKKLEDTLENEPEKLVKGTSYINAPLAGAIVGGVLAGPLGIVLGAGLGSIPGGLSLNEYASNRKMEKFRDASNTLYVEKSKEDKASRTVGMCLSDMENLGLSNGDIVYVEKRNEGLVNKFLGKEYEYNAFVVEEDKFADPGCFVTGSDLEGVLLASNLDHKKGARKSIGKNKFGVSATQESVIPINFLRCENAEHPYLEKVLNAKHKKDKTDLQIGDEVIVKVLYKGEDGQTEKYVTLAKVGDKATTASVSLPDGVSYKDVKKIKIDYSRLNDLDVTGVNEAKERIAEKVGHSCANALEGTLSRYNKKELFTLADLVEEDEDITDYNEKISTLTARVQSLEGQLGEIENERDEYKKDLTKTAMLFGITLDELKDRTDSEDLDVESYLDNEENGVDNSDDVEEYIDNLDSLTDDINDALDAATLGLVECPLCGGDNPENASECIECGEPFET